MFNKSLKILLVLILFLGSVLPSFSLLSITAYAEDKDEKEETKSPTSDKEETEEGEGVSGDNEDSKASTNKVIGMADDDAKKIEKDLLESLIKFGITGKPISVQFSDEDDKETNTELFNELMLTQLQLYELLYRQAIKANIEAPLKETTLAEGEELNELKEYLIAFNAINEFIKEQKSSLESTEGADENLIEMLDLAKHDLSLWQVDSITAEKPLSLVDKIRPKVQENINRHNSQAIGAFFKYLNNGNDAEDIKDLTKADTKDSTKDLLALVLQWKSLPHIKDATDDMKVLDISNVNQSWLEALQDLVEDMETDTEGATDKEEALADDNTSPELATSALGRMGSSLFTVSRSADADKDADKPITGTLGWALEDGQKNTSDEYDPGPAAKDDFLAMFAASAVYVPFVSHIGDKDYVESFKALFNDSADQLKDDDEKVRFKGNSLGPIDILSSVQNLRKPLYYYDDLKALGANTVYGHSTEDVKGVATLLTVGDLIKTIESKGELAAITINGVMSKDGDSWSFYNYSLNTDGGIETEGAKDNTDTSSTSSTPKYTGNGAPILNKIHADKTVNGGQSNTRVLFEMTFDHENPGVGLMTGLLMHNIYNDTILKSRFKERANEAVYVDAIGNLVLNDGLVVLPASANPTYWAMPDESDDEEGDVSSSWTYNPYTVAFMDTYPAIYQGGTAASSVNEKKDKKKYVLSSFKDVDTGWVSSSLKEGVAAMPLKKGFSKDYTISRTADIYRNFKLEGSGELVTDKIKELEGSVGVDSEDEFISHSIWVIDEPKPLQFKSISTPDGDSLFPYIKTSVTDPLGQLSPNVETENFKSGILIAKNMYAYIIGEVEEDKQNVTAANGKSAGGSNQSSLREGFLFNNVTMPVLTGMSNPTEFDKTNAKSDLLSAGGDANVAEKWIINFSKWLTASVSKSVNILGIANSDDVSLLKVLYGVFIDYGYYIAFLLLIVLIVIFLRQGDFLAAAMKGGIIVGLLFVTLFLIPLIIPSLVGLTSNELSKNTVLNGLMSKLEMSEDVNNAQSAGESGLSVKLYNLSPGQAKEINTQYNSDETNYLTNKFPINNNVGMFVEGTEVRLDLYSFWRFDPLIIATEDSVTNPNTEVAGRPQVYHSDHSKSDFVVENDAFKEDMDNNNDVVDYYMPYNLLQNGFMKTINTYLQYYDPPQSVVKYPDGFTKSSYVVNSYMKSLAFLAAEPSIAELISQAESDEEYAHRGLSEAEVSLVNQKFYPYGDIMNLQSWVDSEIVDLPSTYANSLWTHAMDQAGYYNPDTGAQKRAQLANRVNRKAYDVIMQMGESKGLVSDETMIKLVALYATFEFNKEISYITKNIYPRTPSVNEFSASDILTSTILGQSRQFLFYDTSIVTNVYGEHGIIGLAAVDLALIALALYSIFLSWVIPVLIVGLLLYSIYLIFTNKNIMPALIFTFKMLALVVIMNISLLLVIITYPMYENIYGLAIGLVVVDVIFGWLFIKILYKRKPKMGSSWQMKHLRDMRGDGTSYRSPSGENSSVHMRDYLEESGGIYGRRGSRSSRYED